MKKVLLGLLVVALIALGYVFYQYQKIASDADAQVEADIKLLEQTYRDLTSKALSGLHEGDKYVQTQLAYQHINEHQQYVRVYHSLFIQKGVRSCLASHIVYLQKQPNIQQQVWLESAENCLP